MANILVVGDTIKDQYVYGNIERVNPEAPYCLVLDYQHQKSVLGGAANVAANIKSIGGPDNNVFYLGYISPEISEMLTKHKVKYLASKLISDSDMLLKTRYVYDNHIILRLDTNKNYDQFSNTQWENDLEFRLESNNLFDKIDCVVLSDYNKGTLPPFLSKVFDKFKDSQFFFDIKKAVNPSIIPDNCVIKCNAKEYKHLDDIGFIQHLRESSVSVPTTVRTEGKHGYTIIDSAFDHLAYPALEVGEIVDTVGCGDVFLAAMVVDYCKDLRFDISRHAAFGNKCSAIKVKKFGTALVTKEEVKKYDT